MQSQNWTLQDAKAHFSEVVRKAQKDGPQYISVSGQPAVVIISQNEYNSLTRPATNLVDFFRKSPLVGLHLSFKRDKSPNRDIDS